jgi:hypothetical protein
VAAQLGRSQSSVHILWKNTAGGLTCWVHADQHRAAVAVGKSHHRLGQPAAIGIG